MKIYPCSDHNTDPVSMIKESLLALRDAKYKRFQENLIPTVSADRIIGVRTPALRSLVREIEAAGDADAFLDHLPHDWFEEDQLHAFLISDIRNFDRCIQEVERYLPLIDNWATCDQLSPRVFRRNQEKLLPHIATWLEDKHSYTIRFAVKMLMDHFLDDAYDPCYPERLCRIRSDEYYVNMMIAWYFATALAKQYDSILPFIKKRKLPTWVHHKTIQKALESRRITLEQKVLLRSLR